MKANVASVPATHEQQVLRLARKRTLLRARDLTQQGLPTIALTRLVQAGKLERVARGHIQLQETLADDILQAMLAHPGVRAARVATEKPDVYPDCAAVGVEVFGITPAKGPAP